MWTRMLISALRRSPSAACYRRAPWLRHRNGQQRQTSAKPPSSHFRRQRQLRLWAFGSVVAKATVESPANMHIDGANINAGGGVAVSAGTADQTTATTYSLAVGTIFAGLSSTATATATPEADAWISGAQIQSSGDIKLSAQAETTANSGVASGSVGVIAVGPSHSYATDSPIVSAYIGSNTMLSAGGKITVQGMHNTATGKVRQGYCRCGVRGHCRLRRRAPGSQNRRVGECLRDSRRCAAGQQRYISYRVIQQYRRRRGELLFLRRLGVPAPAIPRPRSTARRWRIWTEPSPAARL